MNSKKRKITARRNWINIYEELGSVSKAALRCGISRSTLYRWVNRYDKNDIENSLRDRTQKPLNLAKQKINKEIEELILFIRCKYNFGPYQYAFIEKS
jgi:transposase